MSRSTYSAPDTFDMVKMRPADRRGRARRSRPASSCRIPDATALGPSIKAAVAAGHPGHLRELRLRRLRERSAS